MQTVVLLPAERQRRQKEGRGPVRGRDDEDGSDIKERPGRDRARKKREQRRRRERAAQWPAGSGDAQEGATAGLARLPGATSIIILQRFGTAAGRG